MPFSDSVEIAEKQITALSLPEDRAMLGSNPSAGRVSKEGGVERRFHSFHSIFCPWRNQSVKSSSGNDHFSCLN
jgi:hypothetical protein